MSKYDLCLTGDGLLRIMTYIEKDLIGHLTRLLPYIIVFARMAPKQKEWIINGIKNCGYFTLMCGDGTNDVIFILIFQYYWLLPYFSIGWNTITCIYIGWSFEACTCWRCHSFPLP